MKAFRQIQHIGSRKWIQTFATSKLRAKPNLIFPFCPTLSPFISFTPLQLPLSSMPSFSQFNKHQFISQTTGGASIRCFSSRSVPTSNHYDTLGLPHNSNVSKEQIKRAYFERAKETHPDLNPDDPYAKKNFREVSHAYQILSDPSSKLHYDSLGTDPEQGVEGNGRSGAQKSNQDFEAAWQEVWVAYGFDHYVNEVKEEAYEAVMDVKERNDWVLIQDFASKHRFLLLGIMVPLALALRFPPLILGGLRIAITIAGIFFNYIPRHHRTIILHNAWKMLKDAAKQKQRGYKKK